MTRIRLPTKAWLERTFPVKLIALWVVAAALLTFTSMLEPVWIRARQHFRLERFSG